ncbi:DHH family phosphoesterase [Clostridium thermopalmarium]|uniref:Bifunctional oligoribonuclease and PAP phosphatase NrnA n=1 Tax=Clostridium thermopalmarium DSM 5974 TaxID=1121340 RepID=A0A2T0AX12_9CLOT|nr:bifunctional oligoribonuclease/PAP phosphatase NrnA [Clostridium thermopalmarium]MBE6042663.1 bifunctional oligoribonuclease/PAP phosphatase NrnA [Clostridium thermopalmarium]MBE6079036.1 bifunctional oligoribonuclease/PAP phosphatase NrnA [Clostridium lundense]PRR75263.1 Bifunctional oligoribonuclease and PAP phosphatase NrnA [Clostridium thermopalmarium DSM 5974]PVZ28019.1 phosphoesterase RecJ-like protein [Clostridium thermopalmarium DSM 5974]
MIPNNIIEKIKKSKKIGITCHISPDGDSLGSSLALMQGLLNIGKSAYIISKEEIPETFYYLPYSDRINKDLNYVLEDTDTVIVLDCGNFERINADIDLNTKKYTLINIDHHISNDNYGDLNYIDTNAAAVAEIIYELLEVLNVNIDKDIATCLYTSILTDTGSFRHSNTTRLTHKIAGELIYKKIDFSEIHRKIFENISFERLKLQGKIIEKMHLELNKKLCIMELTKEMIEEFNIDKSDTSDLVNIGTQIDTVEVAILLKECDCVTKVSLRSKKKVDVRKIAEMFNGGGHIRAAGFSTNVSLQEIKSILIKQIEKELI